MIQRRRRRPSNSNAHVGAAPGVALALAAQAHAKINGGVRLRAHAAPEDVENALHGFTLVGWAISRNSAMVREPSRP